MSQKRKKGKEGRCEEEEDGEKGAEEKTPHKCERSLSVLFRRRRKLKFRIILSLAGYLISFLVRKGP